MRVYTEVIRLWDTVTDERQLASRVVHIVQCHRRGKTSAVQRMLSSQQAVEGNLSPSGVQVPRVFVDSKVDPSVAAQLSAGKGMRAFAPPANADDKEYDVLKFYEFSSSVATTVLSRRSAAATFPFLVTAEEYEIIALTEDSSVLLLGRSGTGKTTCCLYRMWNHFLRYWAQASIADSALLPRRRLIIDIMPEEEEEDEDEVDEEIMAVEEFLTDIPVEVPSPAETPSEEATGEADDSVQAAAEDVTYEHLHQVFITKNPVLCQRMHKSFVQLQQGRDAAIIAAHDSTLGVPVRFQETDDKAFPLFLTSRQWLVVLDGSLFEPFFFPRRPDGAPVRDVFSRGDQDGNLVMEALLDEEAGEDDLEDEDEDELEEGGRQAHDNEQGAEGEDNNADGGVKREVTYQVS